MLVLVEPLHTIGFSPIPALGCAMLVGACTARGHDVQLITGQEPLVRRIFVDHIDELWALSPKEPDGRVRCFVEGITRPLEHEQFIASHRELYERVYVTKTIRSFLTDPDQVYSLGRCLTQAVDVYGAYLSRGTRQPLRLVDDFVDEILGHSPDAVGFSLLERSPALTLAVVERLRAVSEVPVICGGAATPHLTPPECDELLRSTRFDRLVIGMADCALPDLLDGIVAGTRLDDIPNTAYRDAGGAVRRTEIAPVTDLDSLPFPDFAQVDLDRFPTPVPFLPVQWGRGCSWRKCAFCHWTQHYFGQHNQAMSTERFVDTLEHLRDTYGTSCFTLQDTELPPPRARKLATALLERFGEDGVTLAVHFGRLIKSYDHADLFELMRRAGVVAMGWGLESGSERVLATMGKGTDVATGSAVLERSAAAGISNHVSVMFGFPGETKAEAQETVDYLVAHRHAIEGICSVAAFGLEPDSLIGEHPEKWGGVVDESGNVTWSAGSITGAEAEAFVSAFVTKIEFGSVKVTSAPVAHHYQAYANFIHCALMNAHGHLRAPELEDALSRAHGTDLVPIFAGALGEADGNAVFVVSDLSENSWVASLHAPHMRALHDVERTAIVLADGTRTIAEIAAALEDEGLGPLADTLPVVTELVREASRDSWVLVFERAWPAASQSSTPAHA